MTSPYVVVFMIMLALFVMEAERTALQASQQCRKSYVAKLGPRMSIPEPPPIETDEEKEGKKEKVKPKPERSDALSNQSKPVCFDLEYIQKQENLSSPLNYSLLMSGVQWGALLGALPGGWASVCCTSQNVLLGGQLLMAISTVIVPLVAALHWIPVAIMEGVVGVGMALMIPSVFNVMSDWDNPSWRTTIICLCFAGRPLGQLATFTLISLTCRWEFFPGWIFTHFVVGFLGLVWCALWLWFGHRKAPCGGCHQKVAEEPSCMQRMLMMKVWSAVLKQNTVWGIIMAIACADLMWMILEMYSAVLNSIDYTNEIWTSVTLLSTCIATILVGMMADKLIACSPESYRYIRKIFDALGKVMVIILSIVMIRLHFHCEQWTLVMTVVAVVTAVHSMQFAGSYANTVDIGDPCAGVTASGAVLVCAMARLGLWNGLYYNVSLNVALLGFEPPLYAIAALLACAIVIYALWGAPEVNLYLPPGWDNVYKYQVPTKGCFCCLKEQPHKHIIQIMDQACRKSESHSSFASSPGSKMKDCEFTYPSRRTRYDSETSYTDGEFVVTESSHPSLTRSPDSPLYGNTHESVTYAPEVPQLPPRIRFAEESKAPAPSGPVYEAVSPRTDSLPAPSHPVQRHSPSVACSKLPVTLEEIDETDYFIGHSSSQFLPIKHEAAEPRMSPATRERRSQRLNRSHALAHDEETTLMDNTPTEGQWKRAESQL